MNPGKIEPDEYGRDFSRQLSYSLTIECIMYDAAHDANNVTVNHLYLLSKSVTTLLDRASAVPFLEVFSFLGRVRNHVNMITSSSFKAFKDFFS